MFTNNDLITVLADWRMFINNDLITVLADTGEYSQTMT